MNIITFVINKLKYVANSNLINTLVSYKQPTNSESH